MAEETTPTPVKESPAPPVKTEQEIAAEDQAIADSPSQGQLDLLNAKAASPTATQPDKDAAKKAGDDKAKADRIKAERASAASEKAAEPCSVDKATEKVSASCKKMKESNAEFATCCQKAKDASDAVKCKKAQMKASNPPVADPAVDPPVEEAESGASLPEGCDKPTDGEGTQTKLNKAKANTKAAEDSKTKSEDNIDKADADIEDADDKIAEYKGAKEDIDVEITELKNKLKVLDTSAAAVKEKEAINAQIKAKEAEKAEIDLHIKAEEQRKKDAKKIKTDEEAKLKTGSDDAAIAKAEKDEETAQKNQDKADKELEALEKAAEEAAEACDKLKDSLAEKYPETFGKDVEANEQATEEKEDCIEEKEDANSEPFSLPDLEMPSMGAIAIGVGAVAGLIDLFGGSDSFTNSSGGATGSPPPPGEEGVWLHWDAPATKDAEGVLENLITDHLQPIYKHSFIGEFPSKLTGLDWMVKTMDRPKIDIEYVEQIRNNVKRQYPIKYNFGDLSMTFHDDVNHKTILTLHKYFTGDIWDHGKISGYGKFKMRDSVLIPEIKIYDLTVETGQHLRYTYQNVSLVSLDYDAPDEAEDGGVYTIQAVFKIEGYIVEESKSPPTLNAGNAPVWV